MADSPYNSDCQNGIFNLFFALVAEYQVDLPPQEAFEKAAGWLRSFANEIDQKGKDHFQSRENEKEMVDRLLKEYKQS